MASRPDGEDAVTAMTTTSPIKWAVWLSLLALAACHDNGTGSGGSVGPPQLCPPLGTNMPDPPNATALIVDQGPSGAKPRYTNGLFASVTLYAPGSDYCQTIDHVLVDTGSVGLRVLESVLNLPLLTATTASGLELAECHSFVDGTAWGLVKLADVQLGGEIASNIPIQVIGDRAFAAPADCTTTPVTGLNDNAAKGTLGLGANGVLGVGIHERDCGAFCASTADLYYGCGAACMPVTVPLEEQVPNPVAAFPVDNNGTIIQLEGVPERGAPSVPGALVFGIGTQANNGLGEAGVLALDRNGLGTTTFPEGGNTYTAFLDSGSNALFFLDSSTSGIQPCAAKWKDFYCPDSPTALGAAIGSGNGVKIPVAFSVTNASKLAPGAYAFSDLAGPMPGFPYLPPGIPSFDWGLPFYFGRTIYTAIEGRNTPAGPGPYFAF
jgi:hypothetical protein